MIWDLKTVRQVQRLYVDGWIDEHYEHSVDATEAFQKSLAASLKIEAQALAVEVDVCDVRFRDVTDRDDRSRARRHVRGAWAPRTCEIEMRGGEQDGRTLAWEHIGDPLRFPKMREVSWDAAESVQSAALDVDTYEISGWSESNRRWVYDVTRVQAAR